MKRTFLSSLLFLIILFLVFTVNSQPHESYRGSFETSNGENVEVNLAVAENDEERAHGLMNTFVLPEGRGMIFVFPEEDQRSFWMKNTYIPLDMVFLDENFRVLNIRESTIEPFASDSELKRYSSEGKAKYVIEFNRGFTERNNISEGDLFLPGKKMRSCCL